MKRALFTGMSIKNKLLIIIVSTSIIAIISGLVISVTYDMLKARKEMKENALFNATLVGQYSAAPILFGYRDEAVQVLEKLESIPSILDACLYMPDTDTVFASFHRDITSRYSFPPPRSESATFSGGFLHTFHSISYNGQNCGIIYMRISAITVRERLKSSLILAGVILLLLVTVVLIIGNRLQKMISEPILNLATLTQKISSGTDYTERLNYSGNDEINTLYRHFDNMLNQISLRESERDLAEASLKSVNEQLSADIEERKRMEAEIRIREERYRYLFERNPACMAIYDKEGFNILGVNEAFLVNYGYSEKEALAMNFVDFYPPEEKGAISGLVKELKGHKYTGEWHHIKKDGSHIDVLTSSHDIDYMGRKARLVVITDITKLRKAEKEISFLAQVLKNINEFVSITDTENRISFVNESWLKTFGYSEEEVIGKDIGIIVSSSNPPEITAEILTKTLSGGWHGELINKRKNGTEFPVMLSTTIIYDKENHPIALVGISTDITELRKKELELKKYHDRLEELVKERTEELKISLKETEDLYENAPCGYHSLDCDGNVVRMNNTELKWLGYEREEVVNRLKMIDLLTSQSRNDFKKSFSQFLKKGVVSGVEFEYQRKDGSTFFGSLNATSITDQDGKIIRSRSTLFDITERKQIEAALNKAMKEAENANIAKSEFLANMSHEIRTPMNAVLGYTELLSSLITEQSQKNYIESIKSSGRSLLTLINDILDLSKIEAGRLELEYDFVDSNNFFTEFERIFALKAIEKGIQFKVEIESGTPAGLYIDEPRLRQIVFNLVGNAIKFTGKGYVKIRVFTENYQVIKYENGKQEEFLDLVIEVEDSGIGISKELREEIFDPFIQARDQKNIGGTGLGLAITKRLTLLMNGTIGLTSELGKGSTFTVRIPEVAFKRDFVGYNATLNINPANIIFEPATVLVVDDVEHNRNFIRDILKDTRIKVYDAEEGYKALELIKKKAPDLIITDIKMPNMDGFELLERIKAIPKFKNVPVLAYSASVLKEQKEKIHQSKFAGLLTKPLNITELYIALMNNLPFVEVNTSGDKSLPDYEPDKEIVNRDELLIKLETTLKETWKTFEKRQPISEIRLFGEKIAELGRNHKSDSLLNYGNNIINAADTFNIEAILLLLKQYNDKIENLKMKPE